MEIILYGLVDPQPGINYINEGNDENQDKNLSQADEDIPGNMSHHWPGDENLAEDRAKNNLLGHQRPSEQRILGATLFDESPPHNFLFCLRDVEGKFSYLSL